MNYKTEISNLKNENEKLWKEINQIKLNNDYDSKSKLKSNLNNRNIENRIETNNSKSQEEKEEDEEDEIDDNNKITNYKNKSLSKNYILPKKDKKETEYNGEVEYQDNPKGYRFKIFEKNPETFTKIINSENEIVNLEFTIINKSKKHFPGYGSTKIRFFIKTVLLI